jgi:hypothetical protein
VILSPVIGLMTPSRPSPSENRADLPRLFEIRFLPPGSTGPKRVAALRGLSWEAEDFWQELAIRYDEAVNGGEPLTARSGWAGSSPLHRNDVEAARTLGEWLDLACGGRHIGIARHHPGRPCAIVGGACAHAT